MAMTMQGKRLVFEDRGVGEPAFVFVHGWTCVRSCFAPQAEHFAQRRRVVSVDLRGRGASDKPAGSYPSRPTQTMSRTSLESWVSARPLLLATAWAASLSCS